jgi:hypothetical protein
MNEFYIFLIVSIVISVSVGPYSGYLMAISMAPIEKVIDIPESANRKFVKQADDQRHRAGEISYITTAPTFSIFDYGCYPGSASSGNPVIPSCLVFYYDGKPGVVELRIPRELINKFPLINEVSHGDWSLPDKEIPFQKISEDSAYTVVRIEVPPNYTKISVLGNDKGSEFSPYLNKLYGWSFILTVGLWFLCLILYVLSKTLAPAIVKKVNYFLNHK